MKKVIIISLILFGVGCAWLQKAAPVITDIGIAVLCELQKSETNDESLNQECDKILGHLTPEQIAQVEAKTTQVRAQAAARKAAVKDEANRGLKPKDGGQ